MQQLNVNSVYVLFFLFAYTLVSFDNAWNIVDADLDEIDLPVAVEFAGPCFKWMASLPNLATVATVRASAPDEFLATTSKTNTPQQVHHLPSARRYADVTACEDLHFHRDTGGTVDGGCSRCRPPPSSTAIIGTVDSNRRASSSGGVVAPLSPVGTH